MKKMVLAIAATAATLVGLGGTANAAPWQPINQREGRLEMRIDQGVRSGALTRNEAFSLRNRLRQLERLEASFRRDGLSFRERQILDRRFDALSRSIRVQKADYQVRGDHFRRF